MEDTERAVLLLWRACYTGNTDLVCQLIEEEDVDYAQRDRNGETVLHMAARSDNTDVINILLDYLPPNVGNKNEQTPLHLAASKGHTHSVQVLLQQHCNPDLQTKYSEMTALHLACQSNRRDVVAALLDGGAVCNIPDTIGKPPQHYATDPEIHKLFLDHSKHCTHRINNSDSTLPSTSTQQTHKNPDEEPDEDITETNLSDEEDKNISKSSSDNQDDNFDKDRSREKTKQQAHLRAKMMWASTVRSQKKIKINHGLGFSEEHKKRMAMNVFDRLMGNKQK